MASAQFFVPVNPYPAFGINYTRITPHSALSITYGTRAFGYGIAPWGVTNIKQTTVIVNPPGFNPYTGWPAYPRGPIVDGLALDVLPRGFLDFPIGARPIDQAVDQVREQLPQPPPDARRGLLPDREEDRIQVRVDRQPMPRPIVRNDPPPMPLPLPPAPNPFVPMPPLALPERPLDNPQGEYLRLLTAGKEAFGRGEYGRASERFGQAIDALPGEGPAWFLRSLAGVALGKFHEAARDLREGLKRLPEGLVAGFMPTDIYGQVAADYAEHRKLLEKAHERFAGDLDLTFLAAVQCWLAGDKVEARARMEKFQGDERVLVNPFLFAALRMAQP
jgi:hypothetical protein